MEYLTLDKPMKGWVAALPPDSETKNFFRKCVRKGRCEDVRGFNYITSRDKGLRDLMKFISEYCSDIMAGDLTRDICSIGQRLKDNAAEMEEMFGTMRAQEIRRVMTYVEDIAAYCLRREKLAAQAC